MLWKRVLPIAGCALLLFCSCSKSEPPGDDPSTSVSDISETDPTAENSAVEMHTHQTIQEESPKATDAQKPKASDGPGIQVGEKAPAFKLKDQNGKEQSLKDLIKQGSVALVFYRSADW